MMMTWRPACGRSITERAERLVSTLLHKPVEPADLRGAIVESSFEHASGDVRDREMHHP